MLTSKENFLASAVLFSERELGLKISLEKMTEIIGDKMANEWTAFNYDSVSPYMDTAPREEIADHIAFHYLGRYWPTYSEKVDIHAFVADLREKIEGDK